MDRLLEGKRALITGAAQGIGKGIAETFAKQGAVVLLAGRRLSTLEEAACEIRKSGGRAECFAADVSKEEDVCRLVNDVTARHGGVDILVNNVGISKEMPLLEMPVQVFDEIMNTNMRSVMLMTKAVLPYMVEQKEGNIINIGSGAALRGLPGSVAYSASKAAVVCFTQALGDEIRRLESGIRVNAICPGPVDTEMFKKSERREFILQSGGDVFSTETVANGALFLASSMSGGMNSQILVLRGINRW